MSNQGLLNEAIRLHQAGRLSQAEALYRRLLEVQPNNADALNLLGMLARQQDRPDAALDLIKKAIDLRRNVADFHFNFAEACRALGRHADALAAYDKAIELGGPDPEVFHAMGAAHAAKGQDVQAVACFQRALQMAPAMAPAYGDLAAALLRQGKPEEAESTCRRAVAAQPLDPSGYVNLGAVLAARGQLQAAATAYARAIQLRPNHPEAHVALASLLDRLGRSAEAESACRRAVALDPGSADAHNALGIILDRQGRLGEAADAYRRATALRPQHAEAHGNLANCLKQQLLHDEALVAQRRALELAPRSASLHSNAVMLLNYADGIEPAALFAEHRRWSARHAEPLAPMPPPGETTDDDARPLRVGYVSPDWRDHPLRHFMEPILASHDPASVTAILYSDVDSPDATTARLRSLAPLWRDTRALSDERLADQVRADRVDILVDLAGHTAQNRLLAFARVPAPVQVTYLGYPNTTGMPRNRMHYRLTDAQADPAGDADSLHSEELVRLPGAFLCYLPSEVAPDVAAAPFLAAGHVTFACFNTMEKVTAAQVALWSELLRRVPRSRLLLKNKSLRAPEVAARTVEAFSQHGVAADRLLLSGPVTGAAAHLARYHHADIALDTYPYHGTTTTLEALWMGAPVVTLAGTSHRSRVGVTLLGAVGATDLVARTPSEYLDIAAALAGDGDRLQLLRRTLRERVRASVLTDAPRFTRELEAVYRRFWRARPIHADV